MARLKRPSVLIAAASICIAPFSFANDAVRQGSRAFFAGKQITYTVGIGAGDTYDSYARLLAPHLGRHLPGNPQVVVVNRPGAGSLNAVNSLYNLAPRDGTAIATGHRFVPLMPLLGMPSAQFDAMRMNYIGSLSQEVGVCIVRADSGFSGIEDMRAREVVIGTTGAGAELTTLARTITRMLDLKFKVVKGYKASTDIDLAIERGELHGRCGVSYGSLRRLRDDWLRSGKVRIVLQLALARIPELPDVPALGELVSGDDRSALQILLAPAVIARPIFAPPDVPRERIDELRRAFDASVADPALIAEADKGKLDLSPKSGKEMEELLRSVYQVSPAALALARLLVNDD
jgi:tripartite-type tricarboxylate transporter receptor subunit TctC